MASITRFLEKRLKLKVNPEKSAVDRPWKRKFLGYSMTCRQAAAAESGRQIGENGLKAKLRDMFRQGRGRNIGRHHRGAERRCCGDGSTTSGWRK